MALHASRLPLFHTLRATRHAGMMPRGARFVNMAAAASAPKREGDISDAFASLSGQKEEPLPDRYRLLKLSLVAGREREIQDSWDRLLVALRAETEVIASGGSRVIPEVQFSRLGSDLPRLRGEIQRRGAAVVRGVIPKAEARAYKNEIEEYIRKNPTTRGFPAHDPQVFELYWSAPQIKARAHPNLLRTQRALLSTLWHVGAASAGQEEEPLVDLSTPLAYADRLRIRQPGDASFALGPHQDGGSVERWDPDGYGRGRVYDSVLAGRWDALDPWDAGARVGAVCNLHDGLGACSAFRALQGWLSMSACGPGRGTLLVYPNPALSAAYTLLRPFFRPVRPHGAFSGVGGGGGGGVASEGFLRAENWAFTAGRDMTSDLQGATPGRGQEFPRAELHPHLELARTMVPMPEVEPGDYVVWHCDTIHAVDPKHGGTSDSSVLYIPVCPVTELNAEYLVRQRQAFLVGTPGPDFPGGKGESEHVGRPKAEYARAHLGLEGLQAFGLEKLTIPDGIRPGARAVLEKANRILGFE
ncbi:hypothetical protein RB594_009592 [Gaeumannomyces avenae]